MPLDSRLLDLQQHDDAADRIRRRLSGLPEADAAEQAEAVAAERRAAVDALEANRHDAERERQRCDDAIAGVESELAHVASALESSAGTNPREAAALSSKRDMLERNKSELEDAELEAMLVIEELTPNLDEARRSLEQAEADAESARASYSTVASTLDAELSGHVRERTTLVESLDANLVEAYEKSRSRGGAGAARLEAGTCQGCHIQLSPDDIDDVSRATVPKCPECGALLVIDS